MTQTTKLGCFLSRISDFEFVSDFEIRISDLCGSVSLDVSRPDLLQLGDFVTTARLPPSARNPFPAWT
jgi:hypothetical protein